MVATDNKVLTVWLALVLNKDEMKKLLVILCIAFAISPFGLVARAICDDQDTIQKDNMQFAETVSQSIKSSADQGELHSNDDSSLFLFGRSAYPLSADEQQGALECIIGKDGRFVLRFDSEEMTNEALSSLCNNKNVLYVQKDQFIQTDDEEEASEFLSWGADYLQIESILSYIREEELNESVTVAIVDSGIADVEIINGRTVEGYDFVDNDPDASNDTHPQSHGTFLASIVADCTKGTDVKLMPVRVLSSKTGSLINAINGIIYAVDHGADVINFSIGGVLPDCAAMDDAIQYAADNNVSVVVSAGNSSMDVKTYCPSHNANAIVVGSIGKDYQFSKSFSNYGDTIDVVAPGEDIVGYNAKGTKTSLTGTSMSAAYVSSCVALIRIANHQSSAAQIQSIITENCKDLGEDGWDRYYGYGLPDLSSYVEKANLQRHTPISMRIDSFPTKRIYSYKSQTSIDMEGMVLSITYADGSVRTVNDLSTIHVTALNTNKIGNQDITVTFEDVSATFSVEVRYAWWQRLIRILLFGWMWY